MYFAFILLFLIVRSSNAYNQNCGYGQLCGSNKPKQPVDPCSQKVDTGVSKTGTTTTTTTMFYYDTTYRQCRIFTYYGSGGNDNKFPTKEMCEKRCSYYTLHPANTVLSANCPCITSGKGAVCVAYNEKYQASTLAEALTSFQDPTEGHQTKPILVRADTQTLFSRTGQSQDAACNKYILDYFYSSVASMPDSRIRNESLQELVWLGKEYIPHNLFKSKKTIYAPCHRFQPSLPTEGHRRQPVDINTLQQVVDVVAGSNSFAVVRRGYYGPNMAKKDIDIPDIAGETTTVDSSTIDSSYSSTTTIREESTPRLHFFRNRNTRQVNEYGPEFYSVDTVRCFARGEPVSEGSYLNGLCNTCWQWGILTYEYWPRYVNMRSCDSSRRCLGVFGGECKQRYLTLTVLKNVNGQLSDYRLNIPTCCDCQVITGSALHNLIKS